MFQEKERVRHLNGYIAVYKPNHFNTMNGDNWGGWVYLHRYLMEVELGRVLNDEEVVHHLDGNRENNTIENLVVLASRANHLRIHNWIDAGAAMYESYVPKSVPNYGKAKPTCKQCDAPVSEFRNEFCSPKCRATYHAKVQSKPDIEDLVFLLENNSYVSVGTMFGVSDNAVRKWVKNAGYDPKTLKPNQT